MFLKKLGDEIISKKLIKEGMTVAVAVSGGVDSMCLLFALKKLEALLNFKVAAVNVEHGIRGRNSVADSEFVRAFCQKNGVKFFGFSVDVPKVAAAEGIGVEECARNMRYGIFKALRDGGECQKIALAHHADDQAETIFMRILRGTGVSGLCGMKSRSDGIFDGRSDGFYCEKGQDGGIFEREIDGRGLCADGRNEGFYCGRGQNAGIESEREEIFIRPFLIFSRAEIEAFAEKEGIPHVEDESNKDGAYTRNFIRNEVFPLIKGRFPSFADALNRLGGSASEITEYLGKKVDGSGLVFEGGRRGKEMGTDRGKKTDDGGFDMPEKLGEKVDGNGLVFERYDRDEDISENFEKKGGGSGLVFEDSVFGCEKAAKIPKELFLEPPLLKIALDRAFAYFSVFRDIEKRHIDELYKLVEGKNGGEADMPFGITAAKEYGYVVLYKKRVEKIPPVSLADALKKDIFYFGGREIRLEKRKKSNEFFSNEEKKDGNGLNVEKGVFDFGGGTIRLASGEKKRKSSEFIPNGENKGDNIQGKELRLDFGKIPKDAVVRTMESGDIFKRFGGGTKKLCDCYTDLKIPKRLRNALPVLAAGNEILAVFGVEIGESVKLTKETTEVLTVRAF
jgi:tRNA(Ile)-lysidine synthetase-like protein